MIWGRIGAGALAIFLACGLMSQNARAQSGSEGIAEIRALEAQLRDPSPIIRLVTLQDALASGKPLLRKFALQIAYAEGDADMKEIALRNSLELDKRYILEIEEKNDPKYMEWRANILGYLLVFKNIDKATGQFSGDFGNSNATGRILRDGLELAGNNCVGRLVIADRTFMQGTLECQYQPTLLIKLPLE